MKTFSDLSFVEIVAKFSQEKAAREFLESLRWPHGPTCPHCENGEQDKIWKIEENPKKKIRAGLYQCAACKKQFTVTVGTIFEDSHIPLGKWLIAWHMLCCSKKGISALQMQRMLGLGSYRSAHFMMHRIRHALLDKAFDRQLGGTVEADETYIAGKPRSYSKGGKILSKVQQTRTEVLTIVERGGDKRSFVIDRAGQNDVRDLVHQHVEEFSFVSTDEHPAYRTLGRKYIHRAVIHAAKQYAVRYDDGFVAHDNTAESSFSLLKRGIIGTFHHISPQYIPLYLSEFDYRWNTRKLTDGERTVIGLRKMSGKRLIYGRKRLNAAKAPAAKNTRKYVLRGDNQPGGTGKTGKQANRGNQKESGESN